MEKQTYNRKSERGNVLFLILIAVALFAALSYAVTKSTRSGSGSTDREQAILGSAGMTQHPTAMRTAVIRMILGGVDVNALEFNSPSDIGLVTSNDVAVFHPDGGGALFQNADSGVMIGANDGPWSYNLDFNVPNIGGNATEDLVAFLPNITEVVCNQVNREFNIDMTDCDNDGGNYPNIPTSAAGVDLTTVAVNMDHTYTAVGPVLLTGVDGGGTCQAFHGQPSGCFVDIDGGGAGDDRFVFFSVLLER